MKVVAVSVVVLAINLPFFVCPTDRRGDHDGFGGFDGYGGLGHGGCPL